MGGPPLLGNVERCKKGKPVTCRIAGCNVEVTSRYYKRFQVCPLHLRADAILENGVLKRFCQQHNKFHPVGEFQDKNRSCRESLLRKKQKSLRDSRSRASQSDSAGNTNSTHNSSSEGSSHGCDQSDFCRQGGFMDDDSVVAPMHAQDLVAGGCLSKHLHHSPTPASISPISIDRMPGESSKDGYIVEPSNTPGEMDAPSGSSELRPWEIFVPPISAQQANPCQLDVAPNVEPSASSSMDVLPSMNWPAMALSEPRQAPLIGQQHLGRMPTSHRIGEGLGISYDHYGHNSSVYQQMGGDLMNIGLKDHSFEESSYGRPVMQDNFMPLSIPHGRNPFAQTNYNKRQNLQQLRFDAMGGSYKTAMNTVSDGISSLPWVGSHSNWLTMKLCGVDHHAVPEDMLRIVSQRIHSCGSMVHGSIGREGCVALHFDLINVDREPDSSAASSDGESDIPGLSQVTDPTLKAVIPFICSEDSPKCLEGDITLQTRNELVHVNFRKITLVLSMEGVEEIVPVLQSQAPVCLGYEGGMVDIKCLMPAGKSPTFFCRIGDSMIKCDRTMQPESEESTSYGDVRSGNSFHQTRINGGKNFPPFSLGSPVMTQMKEKYATVPQCSRARVVYVECECSTVMSAPLPIFVMESDSEGVANELKTLNLQLQALKVPLHRIEALQREIGWTLEYAHSSPLSPQQNWKNENVTVHHIRPFSDRGAQQYENAIADITLQNIALMCRLGLPKLVDLLVSSWVESEDKMRRLREWKSTDGWSLLHLSVLSGNPHMVSMAHNIARITPGSQPLWSWDIRGPSGLTPMHFAAIRLADNPLLLSHIPEFQQELWSLFHTVKADDGVTPVQFLELQRLPKLNDHPIELQTVRMKHAAEASNGGILTDIADTVEDGSTVGCSELVKSSSTNRQLWREQERQSVEDGAADTCLVSCSLFDQEYVFPVPTLDLWSHGCAGFKFILAQIAIINAQLQRSLSTASPVEWQGFIAVAIIICCNLISSSASIVAMYSISALQFCLSLAASVIMFGLFHEERGKDLATFSSFKLQIIYFLLVLILVVVDIKGHFYSFLESIYSGRNQDVVKLVSPPGVCMPIGAM